MIESHRRDRLTMWEASFLLLKAEKSAAGRPSGQLMFLLMFAAVVISFLAIAALHSTFPSSQRALIALALCSTFATAIMSSFENGRVEALRFLRVTPLPLAAKWLLFLPFAGAGVLIALASLTVLSPLVAVTLFGCWCWATAVGHWFAGTRFWIWMVGWLLSLVPLGVAAAFYRSGSWVAAVTLALGLVAWLASPRERVSAVPGPGGSVGPRARVRAARHSARRRTALRMFLLAEVTKYRGLSVVVGIVLIIYVMLALSSPLLGANAIIVMMTCAGVLATANAPAIRDFLTTQPITRGQKFRGLILPWCVLAAIVPTAELLGTSTVTTIDKRQIMQLAYPSDVVRAAWSPAPVEQGARRPAEITVSPALRRLMLGHVGRVVLLEMALFASVTTWNLAHARVRRRRRARSMSIVLCAVSFALGIQISTRFWIPWTPSFWLVVPIAALAVWLLVRELAQLDNTVTSNRGPQPPVPPLAGDGAP